MKRLKVTRSLGDYPRFIADSMLGSTTRKLRIIGFDTLYYRDIQDQELIEKAMRSGRVLLTSDKMLFQIASYKGVEAVLLKGEDDRKRLSEIRRWITQRGLKKESIITRCPVCNSKLVRIEKSKIKTLVPDNVSLRHRDFYMCRSCRKVYWRGRHWKRLRNMVYSFVRDR
jgi:uncharacterized protein with PIN domain